MFKIFITEGSLEILFTPAKSEQSPKNKDETEVGVAARKRF